MCGIGCQLQKFKSSRFLDHYLSIRFREWLPSDYGSTGRTLPFPRSKQSLEARQAGNHHWTWRSIHHGSCPVPDTRCSCPDTGNLREAICDFLPECEPAITRVAEKRRRGSGNILTIARSYQASFVRFIPQTVGIISVRRGREKRILPLIGMCLCKSQRFSTLQ